MLVYQRVSQAVKKGTGAQVTRRNHRAAAHHRCADAALHRWLQRAEGLGTAATQGGEDGTGANPHRSEKKRGKPRVWTIPNYFKYGLTMFNMV